MTTAGVLGAAVLPGYISNRRKTGNVERKTDDIAEKLGEPNGHGTIVDMISDLLHISTTNTNRISELERSDHEKHKILKSLCEEISEIKNMLKSLTEDSHE